MYYLNKIIGWVVSPIGLLFLGLCLGMGLRSLRGSRSLGAWVIGATLVVFWVLGCRVTTRVIGVPLEGEEAPEAGTLQVGGYDAIVLLGGGLGVHEKCGRTELFGGADRAWQAAKLWKAYHVEGDGMKLTLSGGGAAKSTIPFLRDLGVEGDVFLLFEDARNTEEEAKLIKEVLVGDMSGTNVDEGLNSAVPLELPTPTKKPRVLLVTSAWHMPRARMLFERAGLEVVEAPCDYEMHYAAEEPIEIKDFFPNAEALMRNSYAIKEWVARIGYAALRR